MIKKASFSWFLADEKEQVPKYPSYYGVIKPQMVKQTNCHVTYIVFIAFLLFTKHISR